MTALWMYSGSQAFFDNRFVICVTVYPLNISRARLSNESSNSGRVELLVEGVWGTVCYDSPSAVVKIAEVLCRMIGFK